MSRAVRHLVLMAVAAVYLACATAGAGTVPFRVEANINEASVWVDDKLVGKVSDLGGGGIRIKAGFHRVEIRHPGYYSYFQEIEVKPGDNLLVHAKLRELIQ
jgi:hypothetical protein